MINIEDIYHEYLLHQSKKHKQRYKKHAGWFSASSAGSCHRKQWYKINDYEETTPEIKSMRVMRLGTIVHKDVEKAINRYTAHHDLKYKVYTEHRIELPKIKVVGHLDIAVDGDKVYVYDLKTAHSFKWKKVFGRNVDPKPSVNYQLQLGTYGLGMINQLDRKDAEVELGIIWYKKDDSMMKVQLIDSDWIDSAFFYWVELNEELQDNEPPDVGSHNNPVYNWECKYCPYHRVHCEGV